MNGDGEFKEIKQNEPQLKRPNDSSNFQEFAESSRKRQRIESRDVILIEDSTPNNNSTTQQPNVFQLLVPKPGNKIFNFLWLL
jgi:hypothetical protein